jgi:serine/threonine-protein kinase
VPDGEAFFGGDRVLDLVERAQELQAQGLPVDPEELCRDCPDLREAFVQALGAADCMDRLLDTSGGEGAADVAAPAGPPAELPTVPGYEIVGLLGRGGMGVVYRARQVKLNRLVALKMILAGGHASAADLARFRTEAEAIARLRHPHIVQIYEVGEHEGKPYFSLEFCEGGGLEQKLDGTPWAPAQAAALVEVLATAMQAAHQAHVIHRDLKPANVLFTTDGTPKVTDFGLAKKLDASVKPTVSGAIVGTPSYMAPEQAAGRGKEAGPAADVYALGAILYELLTGRPPFRAETPLDTVLQVIRDEPVPPRQLQSKTPRDLDTICLKCLEKDPPRRYASAAALAEDLRRFRAGEPVVARPVGRLGRGWRWCRRNPAVAGLLAAVAATLVLGTAVAALLAVRAEASARLARTEKEAADRQRAAAEASETKATAEKGRADREAKAARESDRRHLYLAQMQLAQRAYD